MILECILTTTGPTGEVNVAPMGVELAGERVVIKPFRATTTYANLAAGGVAVLNITDDATVFAYSALGAYTGELRPAAAGRGAYLAGACAYWELEVIAIEGSGERAAIPCRVVARHRLRDFIGYNRARNAIIEAAILATRLHLLPADAVAADLQRLAVIVDKCGDDPERAAMAFIRRYVEGKQP